MTDTCPSWPTLLAWLENDLPDEESQLLNAHVADCDECREKPQRKRRPKIGRGEFVKRPPHDVRKA